MRIHQAEIWIADVTGWEGSMNVKSPKEISDFNVLPVYWTIPRRGLVFALRTSFACSTIESINDSRTHFFAAFFSIRTFADRLEEAVQSTKAWSLRVEESERPYERRI